MSRRIDTAVARRRLLRDSFGDFVARYWPVVDAATYEPNLATEAIVATLQAVADGKLRRVVIEVGPGLAKTTLLSLYVAWRIARDPSHRVSARRTATTLPSTGSSKRARRVVESDDYRTMFGVRLREDENTSSSWATDANGRVTVSGVGGP